MRDLGTVEKITDASLLFTLADNTTFTLDGDTIALGGLSFDTATSVDGQFTIGGAVTGQMSVTLMNADDSLSEYDFRDAHIVASIVGLDEDDVSTSIQVGLYTVNEFTYNGSNISLVAYDYMSKFDFPCTDLGSLGSLTFPLTLTELVQNACTACGVTLASPSNPIPNGTYSITQKPAQWNTMTWHDVISACAQLGGCYAKVDKYGRLYFDWYTVPSSTNTYDGGTFNTTTAPYSDGDPLDGGTFSYTDGATADGGTFGDRANYHVIPAPYALTVDTDDVYITGLKVTLNASDNINAGESTDTYETEVSGSDGYVITISGNPFIETTANAVTIRNYLAGVVVGMLFRPMQATIIEDPTIEAGDTAIVTGRGNEQYQCFISHVTYTVSAATTIACDAESTSLSSKTRFTQSDKANTTITQIKKDLSSVTRVAGNTNQYFWHTETGTDTGAHITEIPQDEFLDDPENGGGNLLARSNGIAVRDGLTELATFSDEVTIGLTNASHVEIDSEGLSIFNNVPTECVRISSSDSEVSTSTQVANKSSTFSDSESSSTAISGTVTWSAIPDDTADEVVSMVGFYCRVEYTYSSHRYIGTGTILVDADGQSHTKRLALHTSDGTLHRQASLTCSFNKSTKVLSVSVDSATLLRFYGSKYIITKTAPAPAFLYGSLADGGSMGAYSVGLGVDVNPSGDYATAIGKGSTANTNFETVVGRWNDTSVSKAFKVGNGSSDSNRSNAFTVDWSGDVTAAGRVICEGVTSVTPVRVTSYDIGSNLFQLFNTPFEPIRVTAYEILDGLIYFSVEIYINGVFISNYMYSVGSVYSTYRPTVAMSGTGHSTDGSFNPQGLASWVIETDGTVKITLQATSGPYVFISGMYKYKEYT